MRKLTTYDHYGSVYLGDVIPSESFEKYNIEATTLINYFTSNRIKETDNALPENIQDACCEIAELLYKQQKLSNKIMNDDGKQVASETVGPHSKTYVNNSNIQKERLLSEQELEKECYRICLRHIASTGLMYRGGC